MDKEKFKEVAGFVCLGLYTIGFIVFLVYKLTYASYYDLSPILIKRVAEKVMICQSIILQLSVLSLVKDLADGKKWYNQVLIYVFTFVVIYGITGGIMGVVDLVSGKPYSLL